MSRRRKKKKGKRRTAQPRRQREVKHSAPDRGVCPTKDAGGWVRLKLTAELLEDAHLGSGSGGGGIDALVARDRRGHPVIWASHLEGVLRDAARRLRGVAAAGDLFGRAGGQQQRVVFTSLYTDSNPGSRIWRSSARAAFDNRTPQDDTLRVIEHVPKGTRFEGQVELPSTDLPLLRRLLHEVDALGAGRATGAGRVKLTLHELTSSARKIGSATERAVLVLRNLDPLCITATATPDNLIPSLAFVPGRTLLGALAAWLISAGRRDVADLLVQGQVSVSDALPLPRLPENPSTAEVLPAPLSLLREKPPGAPGMLPWWARQPIPPRRVDMLEKQESTSLKRPEPDLFVYRACQTAPWIAYRPKLRVRLRNGRPDPNQADPSLFAVEQVVEDTRFLCELRGKKAVMEKLADALKPVLEGRRWLRVGRGGAPVEIERTAWAAPPPPAEVTGERGYLILTSDLLARDEMLRWYTSLDEMRFRKLPKWPDDIKVSTVVQDTVPAHGFNGTARLWRMPAHAVRRGSVFRVEGKGLSKLARMAADGRWLGERTHEGFGRFRLDETLPGVTSETHSEAAAEASMFAEAQVADAPEDAIAAETRRWFEGHKALASVESGSDRPPSLSQWMDLVADLEAGRAGALSSRLSPSTAGARTWRHRDAAAILGKLEALGDDGERASYARMFVRWLRAELRRRRA